MRSIFGKLDFFPFLVLKRCTKIKMSWHIFVKKWKKMIYNRIIIYNCQNPSNNNLIRQNYQSWTSNITGESLWVRSVHFSSQYLKLHCYSNVHIQWMSVYPEASPRIALGNQKLVQPICQNPTRHQPNIRLRLVTLIGANPPTTPQTNHLGTSNAWCRVSTHY